MAGYCTLVLYFHSPAARENTAAHLCNIQPYCLLTHQIIYMYVIILWLWLCPHNHHWAYGCGVLKTSSFVIPLETQPLVQSDSVSVHVCIQVYGNTAVLMWFASQNCTENSTITPPPSDICVNYCTGGSCTDECRPITGNQPLRINNIVKGTNYTVSLSLRNDFGESGQTTPELFGKAKAFLLWICTWCVLLYSGYFSRGCNFRVFHGQVGFTKN